MLTIYSVSTWSVCLILPSEFITPELIPFIWFGGIAITVYVFFHKFSDVIKEKFRHNSLARKRAESTGKTDSQIDDIISNAPRILNEINSQISQQKEQGVTDEQMKGLYQKKQMLEFVTNNQEIINMLGKPILKKVLGFVKAI